MWRLNLLKKKYKSWWKTEYYTIRIMTALLDLSRQILISHFQNFLDFFFPIKKLNWKIYTLSRYNSILFSFFFILFYFISLKITMTLFLIIEKWFLRLLSQMNESYFYQYKIKIGGLINRQVEVPHGPTIIRTTGYSSVYHQPTTQVACILLYKNHEGKNFLYYDCNLQAIRIKQNKLSGRKKVFLYGPYPMNKLSKDLAHMWLMD